MVLTSTAATAQTTILPNARTTLSMAFHKAIPAAFGRIHPKYRSPTVSTVVFSVASVIFYLSVNWASGGNVISDSVTSSTFFIALYLGITGFACAWHYRRHLTRNAKSLMNLGIMPFLSGVMLFGFLGWNVYLALEPDYSYTTWSMPFFPHWDIGGVLLIGIITAVAGLVFMVAMRVVSPRYFRGETMSEGVSLTEDGHVVRFQEGPEPD
jgi:amino acid transporter